MATRAISNDSSGSETLRLRFDGFELDEANARLTQDGEPIPLAPRPFEVLCALARTPRSLVTKDTLLDRVWGHRYVSDSVLKTTISALRAALNDDPKKPRYIETVSRRGYRFIGAVDAAVPAHMAPATGAATPPPPSSTPSSFTGRSASLGLMRAAWRRALAGARQMVWIAGEPGVGKTTLIDRFLTEVNEAHWVRGQCVEQSDAGERCLPVLEALGDLCRRDPAFLTLVRTVAPTWLLQLPWLCTPGEREALGRELAGSSQMRMLREFGELLERYTESRPLLLVTEDLHWSDPATVQLMDYVARRRGRAQLLWLASFRLAEIIAADHPLNALRHELRLHALSQEVVLDAFSEEEVAEYLAARVPGRAAEEKLVRALFARTAGLPLFVADVVNDLIAHGELGADRDAPAESRLTSIPIPDTLSGIVEHYIQQLTAPERTLIEAASVCGMEFHVVTLAEVLESDVSHIGRACADLARRQRWLTDVPATRMGTATGARHAFRHALYREVVYQRIAPIARAGLHRKVALALQRERRIGGTVTAAELASHFELAGDAMAGLSYYAEAAESALVHFSPVHTMSLTERALTLLSTAPEGEERDVLEITFLSLRAAAAIQVLGIAAPDVKQALERALSLLERVPQHPLRRLLLHPLGVSLFMRGELNEAGALARRSDNLFTATGDRTALLCGLVTHGLVQHSRGRPRLACESLQRALDLCAELDESAPPAVSVADLGVLALGLLAIDLLHLGRVDQARTQLAAARGRADDLNEPPPKLAALWIEGHFQVRLGNAARVMEVTQQLRALSEEHGLIQAQAAGLLFGGWAQAQLGDPRAGHRLIREGYELAIALGIRAWASEFLGYAAEALAEARDWARAREELDAAMRCAEEIGERQYLPQLLLLDARIADGLGKPKRAAEAVRQAVAEAHAQQAPWLEMIALSAVCEREDATAADRASLRRVLQGIESRDTKPVARAVALLTETGDAL